MRMHPILSPEAQQKYLLPAFSSASTSRLISSAEKLPHVMQAPPAVQIFVATNALTSLAQTLHAYMATGQGGIALNSESHRPD